MSTGKENSNLASEFYVMSMLHRKGADPSLSKRNKKAINIIVDRNGTYLTIDVKGSLRPINFPVKYDYYQADNHYYVFVCYMGKFRDLAVVPEVYVVPSKDIDLLVTKKPKTHIAVVEYKKLKEQARKYKDKWKIFV